MLGQVIPLVRTEGVVHVDDAFIDFRLGISVQLGGHPLAVDERHAIHPTLQMLRRADGLLFRAPSVRRREVKKVKDANVAEVHHGVDRPTPRLNRILRQRGQRRKALDTEKLMQVPRPRDYGTPERFGARVRRPAAAGHRPGDVKADNPGVQVKRVYQVAVVRQNPREDVKNTVVRRGVHAHEAHGPVLLGVGQRRQHGARVGREQLISGRAAPRLSATVRLALRLDHEVDGRVFRAEPQRQEAWHGGRKVFAQGPKRVDLLCHGQILGHCGPERRHVRMYTSQQRVRALQQLWPLLLRLCERRIRRSFRAALRPRALVLHLPRRSAAGTSGAV
eukprot:scaffold848_cov247-Pinguiococcus_pyrenoidosus.AAC.6